MIVAEGLLHPAYVMGALSLDGANVSWRNTLDIEEGEDALGTPGASSKIDIASLTS